MRKKFITIVGIIGSIASIVGLLTIDFSSIFIKSKTPLLDILILKEENNGLMTILNEGDELESGDKYQIVFSSSADGYLYVYQKDTKKNVYKLFPNPLYGISKIYKSEKVYLPSKSNVYLLDSSIGKETFFFIFFEEKIKYPTKIISEDDNNNFLGVESTASRNNESFNILPTYKRELSNFMSRSRKTNNSFIQTKWISHR